MKINRLLAVAALGAAMSLVATAQQGGPPWGRPVSGQITEIAADHITIKTDSGDSLKIAYSANTRVMQRTAPAAGEAGGQGRQRGGGEPIKITDLKVGDIVGVIGQADPTTKAIGAMAIIRTDAESIKRAKEMEASFGKTWLGGKVTAINETTLTLSGPEGKSYNFVVDENTSFNKRHDAITLADIKVGDSLRVQGALKGEVFTATKVNVMSEMQSGNHPGGIGQGQPPTDAPKQ
jgi:hypothetical protein